MGERQEQQEGRELGTKPILPLFTKYSFLTFVGMIAQCIMVLCEGIIIGNGLGTEGLACVELIMPMEYLMLALGDFSPSVSPPSPESGWETGTRKGQEGHTDKEPCLPCWPWLFCPRLSLYLQALWRI